MARERRRAPTARASSSCATRIAGLLALEYSAFAVDGRPDLGMVVYNPATPADAEKIRKLIDARERERTEPARKTA